MPGAVARAPRVEGRDGCRDGIPGTGRAWAAVLLLLAGGSCAVLPRRPSLARQLRIPLVDRPARRHGDRT